MGEFPLSGPLANSALKMVLAEIPRESRRDAQKPPPLGKSGNQFDQKRFSRAVPGPFESCCGSFLNFVAKLVPQRLVMIIVAINSARGYSLSPENHAAGERFKADMRKAPDCPVDLTRPAIAEDRRVAHLRSNDPSNRWVTSAP